MAQISLKRIADDCLGVTAPFSVNRDVYGYVFRDGSNRLFGGSLRARSLATQLNLASGRATNICIFLVGHENDFSGVVSLADVTKVQFALQVARDIYQQASLGIRRIFWRRIGVAAAGSYTVISDQPEASDLTDDFSGPNDGIDVFFVQSILNAGGWSTTPGPCDKDAKEMTGAVIELSGSRSFTGILLAHEVGHYLGLQHDGALSNVMGIDSNNDGIGELDGTSTGVTSSQGATMRGHCSVHSPC